MRPHTRARTRPAAWILAAAAAWTLATPALAYIGPGAGFAAIGSVLVLLLAFVAAILSLLTWPFRLLISYLRGRKTYARAMVKRTVILGLDGLDPERTARLMREGKLPHFVRLAEQGGFKKLGTTYPAISPVAWSSFATGTHPSRHAIFDFLERRVLVFEESAESRACRL